MTRHELWFWASVSVYFCAGLKQKPQSYSLFLKSLHARGNNENSYSCVLWFNIKGKCFLFFSLWRTLFKKLFFLFSLSSYLAFQITFKSKCLVSSEGKLESYHTLMLSFDIFLSMLCHVVFWKMENHFG